jgi:hypothetical protein
VATLTLLIGCAFSATADAFEVRLSGTAPNRVLTVTSDGSSSVEAVVTSEGLVEVRAASGSDPEETVTRGTGCSGEPSSTVAVCGAVADIRLVVFEGGEGLDRFGFWSDIGPVGAELSASGGGGNDQLSGGPANAVLAGGPGADRLDGGSGDDELRGGPGADELFGGPGSDYLDGGADGDLLNGESVGDYLEPERPGDVDVVDYSARSTPVSVRLDDLFPGGPGSDGEAGEGDQLRFVEDVLGGHDDDVLIGDSGPNTIDGGPGDDVLHGAHGEDRLFGRDGDDELTGGGSVDLLDAGSGDDAVDAWDLLADARVDCAGGDDTLRADNALDLPISAGCETVAPAFETLPWVSGGANVGSPLTYMPAQISGSPSSLVLQWLWCEPASGSCTPIPGAGAATYTPTPADLGRHLALDVTAANAAGVVSFRTAISRVIRSPFPPNFRRPGTTPAVSPPPPAPPPLPSATPAPLVASVARSGIARLLRGRSSRTVDLGRTASCPAGAGACMVRVEATMRRGSRTLSAGRRAHRIAAGRSARLRITLTTSARRQLARAGACVSRCASRPPGARRGRRSPR